jgi:hypothetical protein
MNTDRTTNQDINYNTIGKPSVSIGFFSFVVVIVLVCIIIIIYIKSNKPKNTQPMLISHFKAKLGYNELSTIRTTFNTIPKFLTETKYSKTDDLPKLVTSVPARYIAIINKSENPINITPDSIQVYTSQTSSIPIRPVQANVVKAILTFPDSYSKPSFSFNNISTYTGTIVPGEIALIKFASLNPIYLYSLIFKYTGGITTPLTLLVFNPADNTDYSSGVYTRFTSFYQIDLNNISTDTTVVIDFE